MGAHWVVGGKPQHYSKFLESELKPGGSWGGATFLVTASQDCCLKQKVFLGSLGCIGPKARELPSCVGSWLHRKGAQWNVTTVSKTDPLGQRTHVCVAQLCCSQATLCHTRWQLAPGCLRLALNCVAARPPLVHGTVAI